MPPSPRHPLIIVGLDGASYDVLDPLLARGELPNLRRLAEGGWRTELISTLPPATLPAWTSFLTAASPSAHGVTDMLVHPERSYRLVPAGGTLARLPSLLRRLQAAGSRVASVGVPGTFPADRHGELCVPGFDAPGGNSAGGGKGPSKIWPPDLDAELDALGGWRYATFNEHAPSRQRLHKAVPALLADIEVKERIILHLYEKAPWDVFFVHLQASDTAAHHLWHTFDPHSPRATDPGAEAEPGRPAHSLHDALPSVYRRLDLLLGRLLDRAPAQGRVLVVSDHGFGGADTVAVHLNRWLNEQGLLAFASGPGRLLRSAAGTMLRGAAGQIPHALLRRAATGLPRGLLGTLLPLAHGRTVAFASSRAFSDELDYAPSIWLNRRRAFAGGMLGDDEARALAEQLRRRLHELRHPTTGQKLLQTVHLRHELPAGPCREQHPDLLIEPSWASGYRPSFLPSPGPGPSVRLLAPHERQAPKGAGMPGVHRREGVLLASGPGLEAMEIPVLEIAQAGALAYALVGAPAPADLEASVPPYLLEMLRMDASARAQNDDSQPGQSQGLTSRPTSPYSPAEEAELTLRLRALGYVE